MATGPFCSVGELVAALASLDGVPSDDVVGALPHLLQTAELLAAAAPNDRELIVAGLLHDLASSLEPGVAEHAAAGARLVRQLLGPRVAELVAGHTDAKRYLVSVEASYAGYLSPNSTLTLVAQGGSMTKAEQRAFESRDELPALVALRRADDAAKVPNQSVPPVSQWRPVLDQVAAAAGGQSRPGKL